MARLGASADQILVVQVYPNTLSQSDFVRPGSLSLSNTGSIPQTQNVKSRKSDVLDLPDTDRIMCVPAGRLRWKSERPVDTHDIMRSRGCSAGRSSSISVEKSINKKACLHNVSVLPLVG